MTVFLSSYIGACESHGFISKCTRCRLNTFASLLSTDPKHVHGNQVQAEMFENAILVLA